MKSLAWLMGLILGFGVSTSVPSARAADNQYVGAKKCRTCHKKELIGNQYGEWQKSKHAKAFESLKSDKAVEYAKEKGIDGPPHEAKECLECHVTGYGADPAMFKKPLRAADGIQCESCHGPGSNYRKKKVMSDHDLAVSKGLQEAGKDEKICTNCHNDKSPAWDPKKYKLADGSTAGFDYKQAKKEIAHKIPEDVKGHYIELEKKERAKKKASAASDEEDED